MTTAELERLARDQRATLLAFARTRARTREDAEDAVQQALAIAVRVRERIHAATAVAYVGVIARHEASRLREEAERHRSLDQPRAGNGHVSLCDALADPRQVDLDGLLDLLGALRDAKPDHARALMARALGWRYREIADALGWTYTKTNRCVTEGRAALRAARAPERTERAGAAPQPIHPAPAAPRRADPVKGVRLMQPTRSILLCEEDDAVRAFLADNLAADGYHVLAAADRQSALEQLAHAQPDLVVCDVNGATLELLDAVRHGDGFASGVDPDVPLIVLTARADELARVRYLDQGSDDVLAKPFSYLELRSRIRALLRRSRAHRRGHVTRIGALRIHHAARQVSIGDTPVALSGKEYALLAHLAVEPTRVFTKEELLRDVWGYRTPSRTVDSHACRLRRKLAAAGERDLVQTLWGVGYRLTSLVGRRPFDEAA